MRCASCGFENPAGLKFCIECGVPLPAHCAQCGFANPPQAKFCGACGTALTDHRSAPRLVPQEPPAAPDQGRAPLTYTPPYLAEKILTSRSALAGERKQVTVLFADIKDSTELIKDLDPEAAALAQAAHLHQFRREEQATQERAEAVIRPSRGSCGRR